MTLSLRRTLDRPLAIAAVALALHSLYVLLRLALSGWDPAAFISAGDAWTDQAATPGKIPVIPNSVGYDGQFYYRLALDPLPTERTAAG